MIARERSGTLSLASITQIQIVLLLLRMVVYKVCSCVSMWLEQTVYKLLTALVYSFAGVLSLKRKFEHFVDTGFGGKNSFNFRLTISFGFFWEFLCFLFLRKDIFIYLSFFLFLWELSFFFKILVLIQRNFLERTQWNNNKVIIKLTKTWN